MPRGSAGASASRPVGPTRAAHGRDAKHFLVRFPAGAERCADETPNRNALGFESSAARVTHPRRFDDGRRAKPA